MKTTVEIPDPLFRRAKKHCAEHGISFRVLIETGIRKAIDDTKPGQSFRLKPFGFAGESQLVNDWHEIREMVYEGRGGVPESDDRT